MSDTDITEQTEESVSTALEAVDPKPLSLIELAHELVITDDAGLERVGDLVGNLKKSRKAFEAILVPFREMRHKAWKRAKDVENDKLNPIDAAIVVANRKAGEYNRLRAEEAEREAEVRRKQEEDERARYLGQLRAGTEKLMKEAGSLDEKAQVIRKELEAPDIPEEHERGLRSQLRTIEAQIAEKTEKAEVKAIQAEEVVEDIPIAAPAVVAPKVAGMVQKKTCTVTVVNKLTLIKAIAEGKLSVDVVKAFDMKKLTDAAKAGMTIPGCNVDRGKSTHFKSPKG